MARDRDLHGKYSVAVLDQCDLKLYVETVAESMSVDPVLAICSVSQSTALQLMPGLDRAVSEAGHMSFHACPTRCWCWFRESNQG